MARRHSLVGGIGLLALLVPVAEAAFEAPSSVQAGPGGEFQYVVRYSEDVATLMASYGWHGLDNVTGGFTADCFCDPVYCVLLPGDEIVMTVSGTLTNPDQSGIVRNEMNNCSYPMSLDTQILRRTTGVGDPASPALQLRAFPNPCRTGTRLGYSLPTEGPVEISVHDVTGRLVAALFHGTEFAGEHSVSWDATGADARRVPPAVYFARLEFRGQVRTQRIFVVR